MKEETKPNLKNGLEITYKITAIVGIFILLWYTCETYKLRKNSDRQLAYSARPYLGFVTDPNPYTVLNKSNNVAVNVFQLSRINGQYFISDEQEVGSALAPGGNIHFEKTKSKQISSEEVIRRMPYLEKLIQYLNHKETTSLVVVYQDLLGNRFFTAVYGSGDIFDRASDTKYVNEL